jgi:DHA3 family tetracycline resistance protein-like MFS transporter
VVFSRGRRPDAYPIYLIYTGAWALFFSIIVTVNLVYQVETVGLSPLQLVLVGTTLEATAFLFEVPTGVVADVYSRRLSVIIGVTLIGIGFIFEGLVPVFAAVLIAQVIWGIGYTFISGAAEAWIVDEVGEANAGPVLLRGSQAAQIGGLIGAPISVALASIALNVPVVAGGVLYLFLAIFLVLRMPETAFHPTPRGERNSWQAMGHTFMEGTRLVRGRPLLLTILLVAAVLGAASEGFDRLSTPHFIDDIGLPAIGGLKPVVWFGVMSMVGSLLGIAGVGILRRRLDMKSNAAVTRALFAFTSIRIVATLIFALTGSFAVALPVYLIGGLFRRMGYPVYSAWLNQHIPSHLRATVLSMNGQADSLGQIVGGPAIGWLGNTSLRAALAASGLLLTPALALFARAGRQGNDAETSDPMPQAVGEGSVK